MFLGHELLQTRFAELVETSSLFHGYIFFGDPHVGKCSFASSLARFIEHGSWEMTDRYLNETYVVHPDEKGTIGIDAVRSVRRFLIERPVHASHRIVIIDEAERLTPQAQHAFLKIAEEPPAYALIILVTSNQEVLLDTLRSRFHTIYFPRIAQALVSTYIQTRFAVPGKEADMIARASFGCVGQAVRMCETPAVLERMRQAAAFVKDTRRREAIMKDLAANKDDIEPFLKDVIIFCATDPMVYYKELRIALDRLEAIIGVNTNKRLQMESVALNI